MIEDAEAARAIGNLEARAVGVDGRLSGMETKVDEIHKIVMQSKGGVKMMLTIASMCATIGGLIGGLLSFLRFSR